MSVTGKTPMMVGSSVAIEATHEQILAAARLDEPVLILGETGVGKELVARLIHASSQRADHPLQVINCAGITSDLLAAELFGHRPGAFTGATRTRAGRLRAANGSSVVLDEVSETPQRFQATLLRTLESGEIQPVGSDSVSYVDVRFIATSNRPLAELTAGDRFRSDLFYRLAALVIIVPPLRDRVEDIAELGCHFLDRLSGRYGHARRLSSAAEDLLCEHSFPGNVRELRQIITRAYAAGSEARISSAHVAASILPTGAANEPPEAAAERSLEAVIRDHIRRTLLLAEDNISLAARMLEIPRSTLQHYLAKYQIPAPSTRGDRRSAVR